MDGPRRDLASTLEGLVAAAAAAVGADHGALYLLDPLQGDLCLRAAHGLPPTALGHRLALGEGLTGRVAAEGRSLVSADVTLDVRALRRRPDWDAEPPIRSYLGLPLRPGTVTIGALELTSHRPDAFSPVERGRASILADAAALLIEQTRLQSEGPLTASEGEPLPGRDPIGVATLNRELRMTHVNRTFSDLVGLRMEQLVGRPILAIVPDLGRPQARDALAAALHGTPGHVGAVRIVGDKGQQVALSVSLLPIGDPAHGIQGVLLAAQDVSARFRLESELRAQHAQAVEARDRLRAVVRVVSHELRTPLTSVLGYAHLLYERADADMERRRHWAELVIAKARWMARLVDEVTDLADLDASRVTVRRQAVDLADLVRRAIADSQGLSERHRFRLELEEQLPTLWLDPDRIVQVLTHLLGNAVRYWPEGGEITLTVRLKGSVVEVAVADHGPGVPKELSERVFEPFYRLDRDRSRGIPGTGLGLAISRASIEAHGGRLWVEANKGGGARFVFTLPVEAPTATPDGFPPRVGQALE